MNQYRGRFGPFDQGVGGLSEVLIRRAIYFGESQSLISLHPFTITPVNCTPAVTNFGTSPKGRPCGTFHGAGAGTDGINMCFGAASLLMMPGKAQRFQFSYASADITNHEMAFGAGVVGTGMIATDPTDYVMIRKLTTETTFTIRWRKANGTVRTFAIPLALVNNVAALANNVWYDLEFEVTPDLAVSGQGRIRAWVAINGGAKVQVCDFVAPDMIPDTVNIAPFCSGRAGGAVTTLWYFGEYDYEVAS